MYRTSPLCHLVFVLPSSECVEHSPDHKLESTRAAVCHRTRPGHVLGQCQNFKVQDSDRLTLLSVPCHWRCGSLVCMAWLMQEGQLKNCQH
jgi:hypothetical protein